MDGCKRWKALTSKNPNAWGISPQSGCSTVRLYNLESVDDATSTNRSPIQVYGACTDLIIDGVYGTSQDDAVALLTYNWTDLVSTVGAYVYNTTTGAGDITKFTIRNVEGTWGTASGGCVRTLAAGGNKVTNGKIENLRQDSGGAGNYVVSFNSSTYFTSGQQAASTDVSGIEVSNFQDNATATSKAAFDFSGSCSNIKIQNGQINGARGSLFGANTPPTTASISNVQASGSTTRAPRPRPPRASPSTGYTVSSFKVQDVSALNFGSILGTLARSRACTSETGGSPPRGPTPFASTTAETGSIDGVAITNIGAFHVYAMAVKQRMGANMPILTSTDTTPDVTTKGSRALCDHLKVLDGARRTGPSTWPMAPLGSGQSTSARASSGRFA
jgi:hypothetical protein